MSENSTLISLRIRTGIRLNIKNHVEAILGYLARNKDFEGFNAATSNPADSLRYE